MTVSVAYGDGIGPSIMEEVLRLMRQAGAELILESIEIGQRFYENGVPHGIPPYAWQNLERTRLLLKAPTFTPAEKTDTTSALMDHFGIRHIRRQAFKPELLPLHDVPVRYVAAGYFGHDFAFFEPLHSADTPCDTGCTTPAMLEAAAMLLELAGQHESAHKLRQNVVF